MNFEKKILKSEIFKLNDKGEPIGIFKLRRTPETPPAGPKDLSKKHFHSLNKKQIPCLIGDLSYEIDRMISKPDTNAWFETMIFVYESELKMTLKMWKFSEAELNPQLTHLTEKIRKVLRKKFNRGNYHGITGPDNTVYESAMWVDILIRVFRKYIDLMAVDALTYISYILHACNIEEGKIKTVFERIKQRHDRMQTQIEETNKKMKKVTATISRLK